MQESEGIFWCAGCFCRREFIPAYDAAPNDDFPPMECLVCGHRYAKHTVGEKNGKLVMEETIPREAREEAKRQLVRELCQHIVNGGLYLPPQHRDFINND